MGDGATIGAYKQNEINCKLREWLIASGFNNILKYNFDIDETLNMIKMKYQELENDYANNERGIRKCGIQAIV